MTLPVPVAVAVAVAKVAGVVCVVSVVVGAGDGPRTGTLIPEGPDTTVGACGVVVAEVAVAEAVALEGATEVAGVLSAGCISTTQPETNAMSEDVSISDMALVFTVTSSGDNKALQVAGCQMTTGEKGTGQSGNWFI